MITLLWLLLAAAAAARAVTDTPKLLQVQIVIRHGDRAPMHNFTSESSEKLFPRGLGELSDRGIANAAQQGRAFRQHYQELGLINDGVTAKDLYIRSSPIRRVLMSAASFSTAFLGKPLRGAGLPVIHTTTEEEERVLLIQDSLARRCQVLRRHSIRDEPACRAILLKEAIVQEYSDCAQFSYVTIEGAIAEIEQPGVRLDSALEKCARGSGRKIQYRSLSMNPGIGSEFDQKRATESIGPLMTIIARNLNDAIKADAIQGFKPGEPVRIYYTHDHNVLSVAQALGIISEYHEMNPEFSSAIAIEIWSSTEGFDIKVVMKDGVDKPFLPVAKFRFLDFKNRISAYELDEHTLQWDEQTTNVYSFAQFGQDVGNGTTSTDQPIIPRLRPDGQPAKRARSMYFEIFLVASMLAGVVIVLVRRRNTYTRMY